MQTASAAFSPERNRMLREVKLLIISLLLAGPALAQELPAR
jgi:hypothetical protein